ncbi:MAG TPA: DLW-39 family protein [Candidatus Brachybacterium merdavium]|uniref:DLW-39 family protein n=1 Tax=Candidatus Brachybacterium merdavium TaxID=2838513 RepID=A0A9D2LDP3_9MICO|nr:DLW-39 family protein [Candidatus Brachybacterium merdavium]
MKKLIQFAAVLIGTSLAGILVWRKVETDRLHNDLWAEAERISAEQEAQTVQQTQASPAERV